MARYGPTNYNQKQITITSIPGQLFPLRYRDPRQLVHVVALPEHVAQGAVHATKNNEANTNERKHTETNKNPPAHVDAVLPTGVQPVVQTASQAEVKQAKQNSKHWQLPGLGI